MIPAFAQPPGSNIRPVWKAKQAEALKVPSLMAPLQVCILAGLIIVEARSATIEDTSPVVNTSARELQSLDVGLESGPTGQAWVHTHWYQQPPSKLKADPQRRIPAVLSQEPTLKRHFRPSFVQPPTNHTRKWLQLHRQRYWSNRIRGKRSSSSATESFRERRHARFGGRAGLGLHWARDQFGHKLVLDRCFRPPSQGFQSQVVYFSG